MTDYLALVYPETDGFWFTIPDIPGFSTFAQSENLQSATAIAQLALSDHLSAVVAISGAMPPTRTNEELRSDPNLAEQWAGSDTTVILAGRLPSDQSRWEQEDSTPDNSPERFGK